MRNIKLTIEYDGTAFHGWQWQPDVRTIQGEIESSLKTLLREEIRIIGSGRTDVGVHALGQVANFHTQSRLDLKAIQKGLNSLLPEDIVILKVEE
ncbi:MAG: tRNA pseudouridine(38-40) synthase TruA, partial [candidate division KSB1 bacterium]|nr:tRNA pseudouridine(38-40) synthase TruA [candidate division KSB1 bacterium]